MFKFHSCVTLCVLVFGFLVSTIQNQYVDSLPIYDDCTCVDTPYFLSWMQRESSDLVIYRKITEPLLVFPESIMLHAERIQYAIYNGQLQLANLVRYLKEFSNLNRFDLMISLFLHIAVVGSSSSDIKADALKIATYAIEKKYLHLISTPALDIKTINANLITNYRDYEGHDSNIKEVIFGNNQNWNVPSIISSGEQSYNFENQLSSNVENYQYQDQFSGRGPGKPPSGMSTLNQYDFMDTGLSFNQNMNQPQQHSPKESCGCNCQTSLIEYLISQLMSKNNQETISSGIPQMPSSVGSTVFHDTFLREDSSLIMAQTEQHVNSIISQAIIAMPQPKTAIEQEYFSIVQNFLQSEVWKNYLKTLELSTVNSETIWNLLKQYVITSVTDIRLKTALEYSICYKQSNFSFSSLIPLLPAPTNDNEITCYNMAKNFLSSAEVYPYFQGINLTIQNISDVYLMVLQTLSSLSGSMGECWKHYLSLHLGVGAGFRCDSILSALPQPKTEAGFSYYDILTQFMTSNECNQHFSGMDFSTMSAEQTLQEILKTVFQKNLSVQLAEASKYYLGVLMSSSYGFNINDLITALPQTSTEEQTWSQTVESFFFSKDFQQLLTTGGLNVASYSNQNELLQQILNLMAEKSAKQEIKTAASSLGSVLNEIKISNKLINILPQPSTDEERTNFEVVKKFLESRESAQYIKGIDVSLFSDEKYLLDYVMRRIAESQAELNVMSAFKYYLQYSEKLAALDLITKKEIKRHFKLTEIFTDTLAMDSLTVEQKEAFRTFFKYISEIQPDSLNQFDSWDQAKTRGEFMKLLFTYLQESATVPANIKGYISVLNPLVLTSGRAALPP